jgi:hypothetical protein
MKKLLSILSVALLVGCTTTSNNKAVSGVITGKAHDPQFTRRYILGTSGVSDVTSQDVKWLKIKGKNHNYVMAIDQTDAKALEAWQLLEVGDYWPQSVD